MYGPTMVPTSGDTPELLGQRRPPHCIPIRTFIILFITAVIAERPTPCTSRINACSLVSCTDSAFIRDLCERCVLLLAV